MGTIKDSPELAQITFHGGFVRDAGQGLQQTIPQSYRLQPPTNSAAEAHALESAQDGSGLASMAMARRVALTQASPLYVNLEAGKGIMNTSPRSTTTSVRSTKLACLGIPSQILDKGSPAYSRCVRLANAYKKQRQKELILAHGYVSSAVSALLAASSLALSASRFLYEIAAGTEIFPTENTPRGSLSMPQILKLASSLSDSARQNELSAWELCARESVVWKRNKDASNMTPWLSQNAGDNGSLNRPKRGPGRPRKVIVVENVTKETELCLNQSQQTNVQI